MRKCERCNEYKPDNAFKNKNKSICRLCVVKKGYYKSLEYEEMEGLPYEDLIGDKIILIFTKSDVKMVMDKERFFNTFTPDKYKVLTKDMVYLLNSNRYAYDYLIQKTHEKYNYKCVYCNKDSDTIDHFIPLSKNGTWDEENLYASCSICNNIKADKIFNNVEEVIKYVKNNRKKYKSIKKKKAKHLTISENVKDKEINKNPLDNMISSLLRNKNKWE